ncbi:hypothetical protein NE237_032832 [Protea cynaroides]|uniref:Uncharacterized protein n=1 Tax=Protea cynaroides TaxID=273540 RepID=A0A9Q0L4B7_9MAGN|nr:hypothetical protein NE237_032832 [Protea cynaroides]
MDFSATHQLLLSIINSMGLDQFGVLDLISLLEPSFLLVESIFFKIWFYLALLNLVCLYFESNPTSCCKFILFGYLLLGHFPVMYSCFPFLYVVIFLLHAL